MKKIKIYIVNKFTYEMTIDFVDNEFSNHFSSNQGEVIRLKNGNVNNVFTDYESASIFREKIIEKSIKNALEVIDFAKKSLKQDYSHLKK